MGRRLSLVQRPDPDLGAEVLTHVRAIVLKAVPELAPWLAGVGRDGDLVEVLGMLPASGRKPGGKEQHRVGIERAALRACRSGAIAGASKIGRTWLAPRSDVLAWLRANGPRAVPTPTGDDDDLSEVRARLARPPSRRRRRAG